jgi:hypothetical protein
MTAHIERLISTTRRDYLDRVFMNGQKTGSS